MKNFKFNKKGFMSIYAILWCAVLLPVLLFVVIDLSFWYHQNVRLKAVTDNAGASAVTMLQKDKIPQGILEVDSNEAEKVVKDIIKKDLQLNNDLTPKSNSSLYDKPSIKVTVVNSTNSSGVDVETPISNIKIYNPSVVVYTEYPVKGLFYSKAKVLFKKVGVSQAQFR